MFDWKNSTVEDLAKKIATIPSSHVQSQVIFYKGKGDQETIAKIIIARKLAAVYRLRNKADLLMENFTKELGEQIANTNSKTPYGLD